MISCIVLETAESSTASHNLSVNVHLMSNISIVCMNALISLVHISSDDFKFILASPAEASSLSLQPKCLRSQCTEAFCVFLKGRTERTRSVLPEQCPAKSGFSQTLFLKYTAIIRSA